MLSLPICFGDWSHMQPHSNHRQHSKSYELQSLLKMDQNVASSVETVEFQIIYGQARCAEVDLYLQPACP